LDKSPKLIAPAIFSFESRCNGSGDFLAKKHALLFNDDGNEVPTTCGYREKHNNRIKKSKKMFLQDCQQD